MVMLEKERFGMKEGELGDLSLENPTEEHLETRASYMTERYAAQIIDHIPGSIYWKDRKGVYLGCNHFVCVMAGLDHPSQIIGKNDFQLPWKNVAAELRKNDLLVMESGQEQEFQERVILADGTQIETLTRKTPLRDDNGKIIGVLGASLDNSKLNEMTRQLEKEKKRIEINDEKVSKKLAEVENYAAQVIDKIPGSVYWKDKEGVYLGCNNFMCAMAGLKHPSQIIGKNDFQLVWKNIAQDLQENDQLVMETRQEQEFQEIMILADGNQIDMLTRKTPLRDENGNVIGVLGVSLDISKLNEANRLLEEEKKRAESANQAKDDFVANMSHDIRTPLVGMLKLSERIKDKVQEVSSRCGGYVCSGYHLV